jgi:hypothetical protein
MRSGSDRVARGTGFTGGERLISLSGPRLKCYSKSGRLRFVFSRAAAARHLRICS